MEDFPLSAYLAWQRMETFISFGKSPSPTLENRMNSIVLTRRLEGLEYIAQKSVFFQPKK